MSEWYNYYMAKRKKKEHDFAINAFRVVQEATGQVEPEPKKARKEYDYKALGRAGGLKGGRVRANKLKGVAGNRGRRPHRRPG